MPPSGPLTRQILAIALPAIIANIATPLMSIMDVAITGHLGGADYIAAIAVGGTLFNVIYWLMGFLRMGTSGLTAQAFGAGDTGHTSATLSRSLAISLAIGVVIILLQSPLCNAGLYFMDTDGTTQSLARQYFLICIWGAPAVLATYSLTGWFLGMQNSRIPMAVSIFVNIVNAAVSLLLTGMFGMKIAGVAIGTLTAQWMGFFLALWLLKKHFGTTTPSSLGQILAREELRRFFRVNRDIFLRTACLVAVTLWFTRSGSTQGPQILAANTLLMQLFTMFSYFMDGFAYSGEALCGRFHGAADHTRLKLCIIRLIVIGGIVTGVFTIAFLIAGADGLALLTSDQSVVSTAMHYFPLALLMPVCGFLAFTYDGICIGLTRTHDMLMSMAAASAVFFATWWLLTPRYANYGLWTAFLLYLTARSLFLLTAHLNHALRHRQGQPL